MKLGCTVLPAAFSLPALFLSSCSLQGSPEKTAAAEAAIRDVELAFSKAGQSRDLEKFLSYYAEEASMYPPNQPRAAGKQAIRQTLSQMFALPSASLVIEPGKVQAARSGELGYVSGAYRFSFKDPQGAPVMDQGKYLVVYRRQADGTWKVVEDIFNSDLPAKP